MVLCLHSSGGGFRMRVLYMAAVVARPAISVLSQCPGTPQECYQGCQHDGHKRKVARVIENRDAQVGADRPQIPLDSHPRMDQCDGEQALSRVVIDPDKEDP